MTEYFFRKIETVNREEYLLVFSAGEIQKPLMLLSGNEVADIIKEWKRKVQE